MPRRSQVLLEPRKSPVQARSAASVDAILEATIQVLLSVGKERLTTTRVALRAGVSVGSSMLQGAMAGVSRRLLESEAPEKEFDILREELIVFVCACLEACSARPSVSTA